MATRAGRPPKLAEQRVLEAGSARKGAVSHRPVPKPVVLAPRMTEWNRPEMPADIPAEAHELWEESVSFLIERNIAQIIDLPALRMMCHHYALSKKAWVVMNDEEHGQGGFSLGSTGQLSEHPAVRVFERNSAAFIRIAGEFGLTPLARTRMGLLDVARRSMESDLSQGLGRNPRRTNREAAA